MLGRTETAATAANSMGPRIIVDKSVIQMLGVPLVSEVTMWFDIVTTPTFVREISGNLTKTHTPKKDKRLPTDVLREPAGKMRHVHGGTPASFKKLAAGNLAGSEVPMNGFTILVGATLEMSTGRIRLAVDGTLEQEVLGAMVCWGLQQC